MTNTHETQIGKTVICRSNENDPLIIGTIVDFYDANGKWTTKIPIVESNGQQFIACGLVIEYTPQLVSQIQHMTPKEQWDYLAKRKNKHQT